MIRTTKAAVLVAMLMTPAVASALVIDFESMPAGALASYTEQGVTFTAPGGPNVAAGITPNGTQGIIDATFPYVPIRADIGGGASFVSVDLGDVNGDPDLIFLRAYDVSDSVVDSVMALLDPSFIGMVTLSVSGPGIAYAIFGADNEDGSSSVFADNFTWEAASAPVPEPATVLLLGAGLAGLASRGRLGRRRSS